MGAASTCQGREHVPQQFCPEPCSRAGRGRCHHAAVTLSLATRGWRDHAEEAVGVRGPVPRKPRGEEEGRGGVDPFLRSCARGRTARVAWDRPGGHPRRVPRREAEPKAKGTGSPQPRRRVRGEVAALQASQRGPPLCDFTGFATSPGRPRPTHPRPLPCRQPPRSALRASPPSGAGPARPSRSLGSARPPAAVHRTCAAPASRQRGAAQRPAPRPGPAERSALPAVAARCCAFSGGWPSSPSCW